MPNFSGMWTLQSQMQAIAAGTWTGIPTSFLFAFGRGAQLGFNDTVNRSSPVQLGTQTDWTQIANGQNFTAAVKLNGQLWAWGSNGEGQLGQNNTIARSSPVQVGALTDWAQVSASGFCAAVKTNGTLWTWGSNYAGSLGQNDTGFAINRSSPVQVGALTDWAQVSAGTYFCAAVKTNGTLWSWGRNQNGQLGQNTIINLSSPVQVGALTDWAQVSAGTTFCAAIKTNGTLWSWGRGYSGQTGQNDTTYRSSPTQVGALTDWAQVSSGSDFCVARKTNGTLWSWGGNFFGQLGLGDQGSPGTSRSSPTQIGSLTDWAQVSAGYSFCRAIKSNGTLWTWGSNGAGYLGQNNTINRSSPVQVGALATWATLSRGSNATATFVITS